MFIYFDYGFINMNIKPYKGWKCYNSTTLWHTAEKLVHCLKRSIMQPLMLKHDFAICKWTISDPSYCYNNIHLADITIQRRHTDIISQFGGAIIPTTKVKTRSPRCPP